MAKKRPMFNPETGELQSTEVEEESVLELGPESVVNLNPVEGLSGPIDPQEIPDPEPFPGSLIGADDYLGDEDYLEEEIQEESSKKFNLLGFIFSVILVLAIGGGAFVYRPIVVDIIPGTNQFFDLFGLRVEIPGEGLLLNSRNPKRIERNGKELILIEGIARNISQLDRRLPEIVFYVSDAAGVSIQTKTIKPQKRVLAPDQVYEFEMVFDELSPNARNINIAFGNFQPK